jgi:hypothetical protein
MRGHKTASLEQVIHSIPRAPGNVLLCRRLRKELRSLRDACADIKEWRDRQIAHLDYPTVFMEHPKPLSSVQVRTTQAAIEGIVNFLRQVAEHCYSSHHAFPFHGESLDGDTLMFFLEAGLKQHPSVRFPLKV